MKKSILFLLLFISTSVISFANNPKSSSSILNTIINPIYAIQDTNINKTKDPFNVIEHTLSNGLKVYLAINENEPRIQTMVAIKTGSKNDPKEVTGLAHYLEHMLFKGTSKMGALDWDKENPLLVQISNQYELYRHEKDEIKREEIYKKIDALSQEAAKYVATNEYDNLASSLGAKGTNAYTSNERTVYINDIPSNELDRWMAIESERFGELVLRLFHTELEAVYEEFNRGQDSDSRLVYQTVLEKLFKKHTYGTQSTIGLGAHLQNPSMVKIHEYFDQYYVPNNMAIILAGDLDPEATIQMIEKYFGHFTPKPVTQFSCEREDPITEPIVVDVLGTDAEFINITFRLEGGMQSKDRMYLQLMDMMLNNGDAGLIDLNLTKKQLVLRAGSYPRSLNDYSIFTMNGTPREGQSLEELKELLLGELDKIKNGAFDEWLIPAVVKQLKLQEIRTSESNRGIASSVLDAFISDIDWKEEYQYLSRMSTITKSEMVAWANKTFNNNYVVVNKRKGDKKTYKVEKPNITEIPVNRGKPSSFATHISNMPSSRMTPNFVDYDKEIQRDHLINGIPFSYVDNQNNELFNLSYILDMGKFNDLEMPLAIGYLEYLGTDKYSTEQIQKEMFKLGLSYNVSTSNEKTYVTLSGLQESFEKGVQLFEHLLNNVVVDQDAFLNYIKGIKKRRSNSKLSKGRILHLGLANYAKYGPNNPYNHLIPNETLETINPQTLVEKIKLITTYKHQIYYFGPISKQTVLDVLNKEHHTPKVLLDYPDKTTYAELETKDNKVYFTHYDMVQTELKMTSKGRIFDPNAIAVSKIFNEYFGSGLSSIVFQEIRESKALAYSAYAGYTVPSKKENAHYINAYIGTQTDKLSKAIDAMLSLMNNMPAVASQFENSKKSALIKMETSKARRSSLFWYAEAAKKRGFENNLNPWVYTQINKLTLEDLQLFFDNNIKNRKYTFQVIGKKEDIDMEALNKLGAVKELSLKELFGH